MAAFEPPRHQASMFTILSDDVLTQHHHHVHDVIRRPLQQPTHHAAPRFVSALARNYILVACQLTTTADCGLPFTEAFLFFPQKPSLVDRLPPTTFLFFFLTNCGKLNDQQLQHSKPTIKQPLRCRLLRPPIRATRRLQSTASAAS